VGETDTSASQWDFMIMLPGISVCRMSIPSNSPGSDVRIEQSVTMPPSSSKSTSGDPYLYVYVCECPSANFEGLVKGLD
jgi:hypothetical protein